MPKNKQQIRLVGSPIMWVKIGGKVQRATVLGAFLLLFIGVGTYAVTHSLAATDSCTNYTFDQSMKGEYVSCVQSMQYALDQWSYATSAGYYVTQNGYFNDVTATDVLAFQRWAAAQGYVVTPNGEMDPGSWSALCQASTKYNYKTGPIGCPSSSL